MTVTFSFSLISTHWEKTSKPSFLSSIWWRPGSVVSKVGAWPWGWPLALGRPKVRSSPTASRATPQPLIPPPMMRTSQSVTPDGP